MAKPIKYEHLHQQAATVISGSLHHYNDGEGPVFETLKEVETLRRVITNLMNIRGPRFAVDILSCVEMEARRIELEDASKHADDAVVYEAYEDNATLYAVIDGWMTQPKD